MGLFAIRPEQPDRMERPDANPVRRSGQSAIPRNDRRLRPPRSRGCHGYERRRTLVSYAGTNGFSGGLDSENQSKSMTPNAAPNRVETAAVLNKLPAAITSVYPLALTALFLTSAMTPYNFLCCGKVNRLTSLCGLSNGAVFSAAGSTYPF